jgi:hypothetical protein
MKIYYSLLLMMIPWLGFAENEEEVSSKIDAYVVASGLRNVRPPQGFNSTWLPILVYKIGAAEVDTATAGAITQLLAELLRDKEHLLSKKERESAVLAIQQAADNKIMESQSGVVFDRLILDYCQGIVEFEYVGRKYQNSDNPSLKYQANKFLKTMK